MLDERSRVFKAGAAQELFRFRNRAGSAGENLLKGCRDGRFKVCIVLANLVNEPDAVGLASAEASAVTASLFASA